MSANNIPKLAPDKTIDEAIDLFQQSLSGIEKGARLVVAMSGGVDSSLVAALAHHLGYEVIGLTLQLYNHADAVNRKGACCAGRDIVDARKIATQNGFHHYVLDFESRFRESVIDDFVDHYLRGETPVPCIRCNQTVKFDDLLARSQKLNAKALLTGHYAGLTNTHPPMLTSAVDHRRDQSWFLFATTRKALNFLRFPLGFITKPQVRQLAMYLGLEVADKADSQDICFVPNGNYREVISKTYPKAIEKGNIYDMSGKIIAEHSGICNYTIGQRRGLGLGHLTQNDQNEPLYVIDIDPNDNRVVVGPYDALAVHHI
ncbi:MAG: tRNA 2-thiouridine(34) synthase MnmA, partial [Pseudomonadota bacterium]